VKKVLVIEPDAGLSVLICENLRDAGYESVSCAPEQAAALAAGLPANAIVAALSSAAVEQSPLYAILRRDPSTRGIPIIVITGRGDATIRRKLGETPTHVIFKPFKFDVLVRAVAQVLGDARP